MTTLRNVDDAIADILQHIQQPSTEDIQLENALERVLASNILSDINLPPFANSAMDGFAVIAEGSSEKNATKLKVTMDIPAGIFPEVRLKHGEAARIMTGAPVPEGANAVIPVEDTDADFSELDEASLPETVTYHRHVQAGENIRHVGENIKIGETILTAGTVLQPADIGILASLGKAKISVYRKPRVAIIGSGDELVGVDEPLAQGQIRDSNSYTLAALVTQNGGEAIRLPIAPDNPDAIRALFQEAIDLTPDIIISSAGVSMGAADYVRVILDEMGAIDFWKINMRPGKPVAFGKLGDIPFFGLPGNPVSAMITFDVIVRPALLKLTGKSDEAHYATAITGETLYSDGRRTYARVTLKRENDQLFAYSTGTQSSGALISMVKADGLLIIPENVREVAEGTTLQIRLLRSIR